MLLYFPPFPGRLENKNDYRTLRILNIFKNVLQVLIGVLGFYKKMCEAMGWLLHNVVFIFQVENGLHEESENIEYLWQYATDFLQSFTMCLGK